MSTLTETAVVEDELSRIGLVGRLPLELVCRVVAQARAIAGDPDFAPIAPGTVFHNSTIEQERFRFAAMSAAGAVRRQLQWCPEPRL